MALNWEVGSAALEVSMENGFSFGVTQGFSQNNPKALLL
jgi:hypothetical protein